jgi:DUSAM domain-containing protein
MTEDTDWDDLRALARQVLERGAPLELTEEARGLLRRTAAQVAIAQQDADEALRGQATATTLLQEIRRRIAEGSHRMIFTLDRAYSLRDAGDIAGARRLLEEWLAIEVVPLYREQAEIVLEKLARLKSPP